MKYQNFLPLAFLLLLASTIIAQQPAPTPPDDQAVRIWLVSLRTFGLKLQ